MTLVVGLVAKDGIAIIADRRATFPFLNDVHIASEEYIKVRPWNAGWVANAGDLGIASSLYERAQAPIELKKYTPDPKMFSASVHDATGLFRSLYQGWFGPRNFDPKEQSLNLRPVVELMFAGYDRPDGRDPVPRLYYANSHEQFPPKHADLGAMLIGNPAWSWPRLRDFDKKTATVASALDLAKTCLRETADKSTLVGKKWQVVTVMKDGKTTEDFQDA